MSKLVKKYQFGSNLFSSLLSNSSGKFDIASAITLTGNSVHGIMSGFKSGNTKDIKSSVASLGNIFSMIPTGKTNNSAGGSGTDTNTDTNTDTGQNELSNIKDQATELLLSLVSKNIASEGDDVASSLVSGLTNSAGGSDTLSDIGSSVLSKTGSSGGRLKNFFNSPKGASTGSIIGAASDTLSSFIPETKSSKGFSTGMAIWDGATDAISNIPGWGTLAGGIMKGLSFLTKGIDAIGAKETAKIDKDDEAFAATGGGYGNTETAVDKAVQDQGKYGLFSRHAWRNANKRILEAKRLQSMVLDIGQSAQLDKDREASMSDIYSNNYAFLLQGGFNNRMSVGRHGMKIFNKNRIDEVKKFLKYQHGRKFEFKLNYKNIFPRNIFLLVEYAKEKNPRFIQRLSEPVKSIEFIDDNGNKARGTHYLEWSETDGNAYVYPRILEQEDGELKYLNSEDAYESALKNNNYLIMSPAEAELFTKLYKTAWPKFFNEFDEKERVQKHQKGGTMNVIPEGALHARLHHIDIDGITKKGIPVVVKDENGNVDQQAEIERNEIIFSLEVTKKLEELWKDGSDEAAIKAGKIIVEEILENTVDNTGLLNEVQV